MAYYLSIVSRTLRRNKEGASLLKAKNFNVDVDMGKIAENKKQMMPR